MINNLTILKDEAKKQINVTRIFNASVEKVWRAWTESQLLDKWWAPKPWKAVTKKMDFTEGGEWLYYMASPSGERHWSRVEFEMIEPLQRFTYVCAFCDENGVSDSEAPVMNWLVEFFAEGAGTRVEVTLNLYNEAHFKKIVEMGFEGGFTMGLQNLEELLAG